MITNAIIIMIINPIYLLCFGIIALILSYLLLRYYVMPYMTFNPHYCDNYDDIITFKSLHNRDVHALWFPYNETCDGKHHNVNDVKTVIYSHGNISNIKMNELFCRHFSEYYRVNVFAYEYIGYYNKRIEPYPSEQLCYESIEAAYRYVLKTLYINPNNIYLLGHSLGSGPTCHLASRISHNIAGVILISPYMSIVRVKFSYIMPMLFDMFINIMKIDKIKYPIHIFHGKSDDVIDYHHSIELFDKVKHADSSLRLIPNCDHADIYHHIMNDLRYILSN